MLVSDLCAHYLRSVKKSDRSPATYTNYHHRLRDLVRFLDQEGIADVRGMTTQAIELYRLEMHDRLMPSSVSQALMVVSGLFSWAIRMRLVDYNPRTPLTEVRDLLGHSTVRAGLASLALPY